MWGGAAADLASDGHDVDWVGDWPADPGDEQILTRAASEHRVLVTADKDFGELAVLRGVPHHGIVRLVRLRGREQGHVAAMVLRLYGNELCRGAIVTAELGRVRVKSGG